MSCHSADWMPPASLRSSAMPSSGDDKFELSPAEEAKLKSQQRKGKKRGDQSTPGDASSGAPQQPCKQLTTSQDVDDRARRAMVATSEKYSKGHETLLGAGRFNARADSDRKNRAATPAAQRAADAHLAPRHAALAALGRELDAKRACKA